MLFLQRTARRLFSDVKPIKSQEYYATKYAYVSDMLLEHRKKAIGTVLGLVGIGGFSYWAFGGNKYLGKKVGEIVETDEMKKSATELASDAIEKLSQDEKTQRNLTYILGVSTKQLTLDADIQEHINKLLSASVIDMCNDEKIQNDIGRLLGDCIGDMYRDPIKQDETGEFVVTVLQRDDVREQFGETVVEGIQTAIKDTQTRREVYKFAAITTSIVCGISAATYVSCKMLGKWIDEN